jgi:hypothetical protein
MRFSAITSTILTVLLTSGLALAQEDAPEEVSDESFGVTTQVPEGWEQVSGNERAVFNFKEQESQSQIEVIGTRLMTSDVADVFFDTFHETLQNSGFTRDSTEEDVTIGDYTGTKSMYTFTHTGVTLEVPVFQFVEDNVAWLVVGYIQQDVADEYTDDFTGVIENLGLEG